MVKASVGVILRVVVLMVGDGAVLKIGVGVVLWVGVGSVEGRRWSTL